MKIIVVESPTKARTFASILKNSEYQIVSTLGHIRDLPENKIAIDYQNNFFPHYQVIKSKEKIINKIKALMDKNSKKEVILATDPDREGEAISYHLAYILGYVKENWPNFVISNDTLKRIVFHEITEKALKDALANPQKIRESLVKAQIARRLLDRIVGYEISPILWKKTGKKWLSAGRVQTVALRLIIEREKEINNFSSEKYYQIFATFKINNDQLEAKLIKKDDQDLEVTKKLILFDGEYQYTKTKIDHEFLSKVINELNQDQFFINKVETKEIERIPSPPFTTSLLQQQAFYQFGFSSKTTMKIAQDLFENGLITYHRTDSFNLSPKFLNQARKYIGEIWGENYLPEKPRIYKTKSKLAQEAHEAIRPTQIVESPPLLKKLSRFHQKLYQLIFKRAIATQMQSAKIKNINIFVKSNKNYLFETKIETILFDGFLKIYNDKKKDNQNSSIISSIKPGLKIELTDLRSEEKLTNPPPRYNEASLIKSLEQKGIGRPSTYSMILSLIQQKNYVEKEGKNFMPTVIGSTICQFLIDNFNELFDLDFTAKMEDDLDKIANSNADHISLLKKIYKLLKAKKDLINYNEKIKIETQSEEKCPNCQSQLVLRYSKFGKFFACSNFPKCRYTKKYLNFVKDAKCPLCGGKVIIKISKSKKRFYGCENYPKCQFASWKLPKKDDWKNKG
jgi:DNA topoisomerase-1